MKSLKKAALASVSGLLVMACGSSNQLKVADLPSGEPPVGPIISDSIEIIPSYVPPKKYLCVTSNSIDSSWPVGQVMFEWNKNSVNEYKFEDDSTFCLVHIAIYERDQKNWGDTTFPEFEHIKIFVKAGLSKSYKQHVLCHELGHVLGLIHNKDPDSCMNIDHYYRSPTLIDLGQAAQTWSWSRVTNALHNAGF